jgi:hypothetical protein
MKGMKRKCFGKSILTFEKRTKINVQNLKLKIFYEKRSIVTIFKNYRLAIEKNFFKL